MSGVPAAPRRGAFFRLRFLSVCAAAASLLVCAPEQEEKFALRQTRAHVRTLQLKQKKITTEKQASVPVNPAVFLPATVQTTRWRWELSLSALILASV